MRLFFSNTKQPASAQDVASLSLGGYISTSPVPNGELNGILNPVSRYRSRPENRETPEYTLLVLKNTLAVDVENIRVWYDLPEEDIEGTPTITSQLDLELALVDPAADDCGDLVFETIRQSSYQPIYGTFQSANKEVNAIDGGTLASGEYFGIWIKSSILVSNIAQPDCDTLNEQFEAKLNKLTKQTVKFSISYDEVIA